MQKYENMLFIAADRRLNVKEKRLLYYDGLICGHNVAISDRLKTSAEKAGVLAEEIGHDATSAGDILNYADPNNFKQEVKARTYGYNLMISLDGIVDACKAGCQNAYETAEYLGCTEGYLREAIDRYRGIYGLGVKHNGYWISFEPSLTVRRDEAQK